MSLAWVAKATVLLSVALLASRFIAAQLGLVAVRDTGDGDGWTARPSPLRQ